jgi:hypothetical protein
MPFNFRSGLDETNFSFNIGFVESAKLDDGFLNFMSSYYSLFAG